MLTVEEAYPHLVGGMFRAFDLCFFKLMMLHRAVGLADCHATYRKAQSVITIVPLAVSSGHGWIRSPIRPLLSTIRAFLVSHIPGQCDSTSCLSNPTLIPVATMTLYYGIPTL